MQKKNKIVVPFRGLKEGWHEFDFVLDDAFFSELEYSEIKKGNVKVHIDLNKQTNHLELEIALEGVANVMCDRCLDCFNMPVEFDSVLYVKFSGNKDEEETSDDDLMILTPEDHEVDLTHYLYESVSLSLPYQRVHPGKKGKNACNPEMIAKLKELSGSSVDDNDEDEIDPRWNKLKNLNNN